MSFRVIYDACAIFGALQRSILIRVGEKQAAFNLRVLLTDEILDEMTRSVQTKYPDFSGEQARSLRAAILEAIPDCLIVDYGYAVERVDIRDVDDRHVVAAGIHAKAQLIVTDDVDFTPTSLRVHGIEAQKPDDFLTDLFDLNETIMRQIVAEEATARDVPVDELIELLDERIGLIRFSQHLCR